MGRSLLVRALWFVFVGWWATAALINVAWALNATIVLIPLGVKLTNLVPTALTLAEPDHPVDGDGRDQPSLVVRAVYFVLVGWWLSWLWANLAMVFVVSIIGFPLGIWMLHRLPYVTSLYRFKG